MILLTPLNKPDRRLAVPEGRITAVVPVFMERLGSYPDFTRVYVEGLERPEGDRVVNWVDVSESVPTVAELVNATRGRAM